MIEFLQSLAGRVIISIVWGLGLACLFRASCKNFGDGKCLVVEYRGPPPKEVQRHYHQFDDSGNCYNFTPYLVPCPDGD